MFVSGLISGLLVGAVFGFVLQRGRFCVTGAYRDLWTIRSSRWFTAFLVVIAVHSVGLFALQGLGVIHLESAPFAWPATIIGAFVFGFGIVLAGGCATGTYYRAGEGLVGSWFALIAYTVFAAIMKSGPLAGVNEAARSVSIESSTIYGVLGVSPWVVVAALVLGVGLAVRHHLAGPKLTVATLPPEKSGLAHLLFERSWNPFATAAVIGVIATVAWPLSAATGRNDGLGITTPSAHLATFLTTGDTRLVDWGVLLVVGILIGSFIAARASGEFRIRVPDAGTVVKSLAGGALMGIGASLAGGCTVGNGMVQTAQLSLQGWTALIFMVLGTGLAAKLTIRTPARSAGKGRVPVA